MPKEVSEISSGGQFSRSSNDSQLADSQTRTYRILKATIDEVVDIQQACGVRIGDEHPYNTNLYCVSFDARFEGDSRMVISATFNYQSTSSASSSGGGADPRSQPPDVRPANWTVGSALYEIPLRSFFGKRTDALEWDNGGPAKNSAGDMYDGVSAFDALVTISVVQFEPNDPTRHARHVGAINSDPLQIGSLAMQPHTVMLRGISSQPTVESWGDQIFRGWNCTYELAYKANDSSIHFGADGAGGFQLVELGWDIALPQTGFNVKAFTPPGDAKDEVYGQPLKHKNGKIADPEELPEKVNPGDKVRGMVKVFEYEDGGASQLPCAQPIPLNDSGRPRSSDLDPLVYGYQVHRAINFVQTLNLRLL
jgi:hypothetical protein